MAWQKLLDICPECGELLYADTSTGDAVCLECDYESGHKVLEAIIDDSYNKKTKEKLK